MKVSAILPGILLSTAALLHAGPKPAAPAPPPAAEAHDATLFPIPKLGGSFWERERLLGDLGGPRQSLAEHGIQIDFNMAHTYQGVFDGGESQGWSQRVSDSVNDALTRALTRGVIRLEESDTLLGRVLTRPIERRGDITLGEVIQDRINRINFGNVPGADLDDAEYHANWRLELKLDTAKMGLWPGGFVFMRAEQGYGRDIAARSGALLPTDVNSSLPSPGLDDVVLSNLYIVQFLSEHLALIAGKLDVMGGDANEFAHILGDDRFLGMAFNFNPVVALTAPYSPLGAGVIILPTKDLTVTISAIDGEGTPTRSGFDTVWEGKTTYMAEGRLTTHFGGKTGHQLLGVTYGSGNYGELEQPLRAFLPDPFGVPKNISDETWAVYWNIDQYLWNPTITSLSKDGKSSSSEVDHTRGVGIFGRVGFADESTNPIAQFYSAGIGGRGLGSGRPHDRWGIGWYYMKTSDDLPDFLHLSDEQGAEAFYTFAVTPAFLITADLQVTDSAKEGIGTAFIGGLRATLRF